jgi:hypothetical protein
MSQNRRKWERGVLLEGAVTQTGQALVYTCSSKLQRSKQYHARNSTHYRPAEAQIRPILADFYFQVHE